MHPDARLAADLARAGEFHVGVEAHAQALFTPEEHAYCQHQADPAVHYAGRWCAKEAVVKAVFPFHRLTTREVHIVEAADGSPRAVVQPNAVERDGLAVRISITHTPTTACAFAVAVRFGQQAPPAR